MQIIIEETKNSLLSEVKWPAIGCRACLGSQSELLQTARDGDALHLWAAGVTEAPRIAGEFTPLSRPLAHCWHTYIHHMLSESVNK